MCATLIKSRILNGPESPPRWKKVPKTPELGKKEE
jgi:hypothetical protein